MGDSGIKFKKKTDRESLGSLHTTPAIGKRENRNEFGGPTGGMSQYLKSPEAENIKPFGTKGKDGGLNLYTYSEHLKQRPT